MTHVQALAELETAALRTRSAEEVALLERRLNDTETRLALTAAELEVRPCSIVQGDCGGALRSPLFAPLLHLPRFCLAVTGLTAMKKLGQMERAASAAELHVGPSLLTGRHGLCQHRGSCLAHASSGKASCPRRAEGNYFGEATSWPRTAHSPPCSLPLPPTFTSEQASGGRPSCPSACAWAWAW